MLFYRKHIYWRQVLGLFFFFLVNETLAQQLYVADGKSKQGIESLGISSNFTHRYLRDRLWEYFEQGYIFADWDTLFQSADSVLLRVNSGSKYNWSESSLTQLSQAKKQWKKHLNNGYPYAFITVDSIALKDQTVFGLIQVETGPSIVFDSLSIRGRSGLSPTYLHAALNFSPGDKYSERKYRNIGNRLSSVKQVTLLQSPDIGFSAGKATVLLDLESQKADRFEGILGVLPEAGERSQVTGYLNLDLNNLFRSGKEFHFNWNRFASSSQSLDLSYQHPYLFQSVFVTSVKFSLLRQDSSFVKRDFGIAFEFPLTSKLKFGLAISSKASDILGSEPDPDFGLDYRLTDYRPTLTFGSSDNPPSLRDQWSASLGVGVGDKRIRRNVLFSPELYDSLQLRSGTYTFDFLLNAQKRIASYGLVFNRLSVGS